MNVQESKRELAEIREALLEYTCAPDCGTTLEILRALFERMDAATNELLDLQRAEDGRRQLVACDRCGYPMTACKCGEWFGGGAA